MQATYRRASFPEEIRVPLLGVALRGYMRLLLLIAPWHPYPDVLTAEQAFASGAAQLHGALLYNCGLLCRHIGVRECRFSLRALQFATLLIETRFVSHGLLIKAISLYRDAHLAITADDHAWHLGIRFLGVRSPPKPHLDNMCKLIQSMEKKAVRPDAWAHEHCLTSAHEGCM